MISCDQSASTFFSSRGIGGTSKQGIDIRCDTNTNSNKFHIHLKVKPNFKSEPSPIFTTARESWFHCTVVYTTGINLGQVQKKWPQSVT